MCGGRSLHKKDWLNIGLGLGAAGIGAGMAGGVGGLLGGGAAPGEAAGAFVGTAADLPTVAGGALKGLQTLQKADALMKLTGGGGDQAQQYTPMQRPQAASPFPDIAELFAGIYPQRKRKENDYV